MTIIEEPPTPPPGDRLTMLDTSWTQVRTAHTAGPAGAAAMRDLIGRYHDAVERYLRLKLLSHKLAGADDSKGRFRDYLRTVLHRLIVDHFRGRKLQPLPPGDLLDPATQDLEYDRVWREAIIRRVWSRLETYEASTPKNRYATVLHLRVENPDDSIDELAATLAGRVGATVTAESFRKTLQRARGKFLGLLIEELRVTIHPATPEDIEAEIFDLGLGNLYRRYSADSD